MCQESQIKMENELFDAATYGNLEKLRAVIRNDKLILGKFVAGCFTWSPFLVAASQGHKEFLAELLRVDVKLAQALDSQKRSALHLAASEGHVEVVKLLLIKLGSNICLSRDQNGRAPLDVAAINGEVLVVEELLRANLDVARTRLDRDQTILHLCVKHNQFAVVKLLLATIKDEEFVNVKDDCGNTVLHTSVYQKQVGVIEYLLLYSRIKVNARNLEDQTALDILFKLSKTAKVEEKEELESIKGFLLVASGKRSTLTGSFDWLERKDILMVVASVFATTSFQAAMNPPGGFWQDNSDGHKAGEPVMATNKPRLYSSFMAGNTFTFFISMLSMLVITFPFPSRKRILVRYLGTLNCLVILSMGFTYDCFIFAVATEFSNRNSEIYAFTLLRSKFTIVGAVAITFTLFYCVIIINVCVRAINLCKKGRRGKNVLAGARGASLNSSEVQETILIQSE